MVYNSRVVLVFMLQITNISDLSIAIVVKIRFIVVKVRFIVVKITFISLYTASGAIFVDGP